MNVDHNEVKYADAAHQMKAYGQLSTTFGGKGANQQIPSMMEKKQRFICNHLKPASIALQSSP